MNDRAVKVLAWMSVAAWLASWFLPVLEDYSGGAAFLAALKGPLQDSSTRAPEDAVMQIASALTNLVFPIMFAMILRNRVVHPARLLRVAILCLVIDLYWLVELVRAGEWSGLLPGYYVWLVAFALMVAIGITGVVSDRRTSRTPTAGTRP